MASLRALIPLSLSTLPSLRPLSPPSRSLLPHDQWRPLFHVPLPISFALGFAIPWTLADLWEGVLRAVPKKKTSHQKKRSRFLAGKALKDVTALNRCSACGNIKRAHLLCPYCVGGAYSHLHLGSTMLNTELQTLGANGKQRSRRKLRRSKQRNRRGAC